MTKWERTAVETQITRQRNHVEETSFLSPTSLGAPGTSGSYSVRGCQLKRKKQVQVVGWTEHLVESVRKQQQNCPFIVQFDTQVLSFWFGLIHNRIHRCVLFRCVGSHPGIRHKFCPRPQHGQGKPGGARTEKGRFSGGKKQKQNHTHTPTHGTERGSQSSRAKLASPDTAPPDRFTRALPPPKSSRPPRAERGVKANPLFPLRPRAQRTAPGTVPGAVTRGAVARSPGCHLPSVLGSAALLTWGDKNTSEQKKESQ